MQINANPGAVCRVYARQVRELQARLDLLGRAWAAALAGDRARFLELYEVIRRLELEDDLSSERASP